MLFVVAYLVSIIAANLFVAKFGVGASYVNAFLFIGLDLVARDKLHNVWQRSGLIWKMGLLILSGSVLSYILNGAAGSIALASCLAFGGAAIADALVFSKLKGAWLVKSNGSNIAGALVDSLIFPTVAFGGLNLEITALQFIAKSAGGFFWSLILGKFTQSKKIYLAGPINGMTDGEANDWRNAATKQLGESKVFNPMTRDFRGRENEVGVAREIVLGDLADIDASSGLLVYFERPSVGTSMEVFYAFGQGKKIVVVNKSGKPLSPWLTYHSHAEFTDIEAACQFFQTSF